MPKPYTDPDPSRTIAGPAREAAQRQSQTARTDEHAEADIAPVERDLREHHLGDVDRRRRRAWTTFQASSTVRSAREPKTSRKPSPTSRQCPRLSIRPACSRAAGILASSPAENRNDAAFSQVGEIGALRRDQDAADHGADHPGQVLAGLQERRRVGRVLVGDQVRHPGIHRRSEKAGGDPRSGRKNHDRAGAAGERQHAEDRDASEIGDDQQAACEKPVDERCKEKTDHDDRQEVGDQERADPGARAGPVEDIDRERDRREIRPCARPERRDQKAPEIGRASEEIEAEDARDPTQRAGGYPPVRLVGEVRPQPALDLGRVDRLARRVVLDLVAADAGRR